MQTSVRNCIYRHTYTVYTPPHTCIPYVLTSHLEGFFKVVLLLQEQSIVDDDLGSGYLEINDPVVHCLSTLCSKDGSVCTHAHVNSTKQLAVQGLTTYVILCSKTPV